MGSLNRSYIGFMVIRGHNWLGLTHYMLGSCCMMPSSCVDQVLVEINTVDWNEVIFSVGVSHDISGFIESDSIPVDVSFEVLVSELSFLGFVLHNLNNVSDHCGFICINWVDVVVIVQIVSVFQGGLKDWFHGRWMVQSIVLVEPDFGLSFRGESDHIAIHIERA